MWPQLATVSIRMRRRAGWWGKWEFEWAEGGRGVERRDCKTGWTEVDTRHWDAVLCVDVATTSKGKLKNRKE